MSKIHAQLKFVLPAALAILVVGALAACAGTPPPVPPPPNKPTDIEIAVVPEPTPTAPIAPEPTPVLMASDDGCVECHTNQEMLIATADEEEVAEELSEGEG